MSKNGQRIVPTNDIENGVANTHVGTQQSRFLDHIGPVNHDHSHGHSHDHSHDHHHENEYGEVSDLPSHDHDHRHEHHNTLSKIAEKIKSVDGIDETANLLGQILPGIAAPIATATILAVATPFVWLGVLGMREEYEEARQQLVRILQNSDRVGNRFKQLIQYACRYQAVLRDEFNINNIDSDTMIPQEEVNDENYMSFVEAIVDQLSLNNKRIIAELGSKYGWTGIVGMSGMFLGMLPATVSSILELVDEIQQNALLHSTAHIMHLVAGACFLPGQAAMGFYAYNRKKQGVIAQDVLLKIKDTFLNASKDLLADEQRSNVEQIMDRMISYNKAHSIDYGNLTVIGQAFMIAGTISSIAGAGLEAIIPLFSVGAPATIYAAIDRILQHGKEQSFKGEKVELDFLSTFMQDVLHRIDPLRVCTDNFGNDAAAFLSLGDILSEVSNKLAEAKLCSLLSKLVKSNKTDKMQFLDNLFFNDGSASHNLRIQGSELEDVVVKKVRDIIARDHSDIEILLGQGLNGLKARIVDKFEVLDINDFNNDDIEEMLRDTKKALKFLRFAVVDSIVKVSHMVEASKVLSVNNSIEEQRVNEEENGSLETSDIGVELNVGEGEKQRVNEDRNGGHLDIDDKVGISRKPRGRYNQSGSAEQVFTRPKSIGSQV